MADDRMKDDDLRNMGNKGEGQDFGQGQQTPGRNPQSGQQTPGQQTGGQQRGGQKNMEDDEEFGTGSGGQGFDTGKQTGTQNRGGQNR